jgi:SAM-dependent methyltransferase/DNA-binding transcriptional ArsR family regulator
MNHAAAPANARHDIHDRLGSLADPTRTRLLLLLARHELSVGELCGALQLPQSTVSRHLKVLSDEAWLTSRAEGPSRFYRLAPRLDASARRLWQAVREDVASRPESSQDEARAQQALEQRRTRSQEFFSTAVGHWDAVRAELFGVRGGLAGLLALLDDDIVIGDLGCGTGAVTSELAAFAGRVIAVDDSKAMLSAARRRLHPFDNVELRTGALESLPIEAGELDAALISLVLHYVPEPAHALAEAHRALKPGGRLVVVDMMQHGRAEYREQYGHVWLGFSEAQVRGWLEEAGFTGVRWHALAPDPSAKGPVLFAASAKRSIDPGEA